MSESAWVDAKNRRTTFRLFTAVALRKLRHIPGGIGFLQYLGVGVGGGGIYALVSLPLVTLIITVIINNHQTNIVVVVSLAAQEV